MTWNCGVGSFDIRLGSPSGQTIGTVNYPATNGWDNYQWNGTPNLDSSATGVVDVYIVMTEGAANVAEFWLKNE